MLLMATVFLFLSDSECYSKLLFSPLFPSMLLYSTSLSHNRCYSWLLYSTSLSHSMPTQCYCIPFSTVDSAPLYCSRLPFSTVDSVHVYCILLPFPTVDAPQWLLCSTSLSHSRCYSVTIVFFFPFFFSKL